jgi:hypothetical protein
VGFLEIEMAKLTGFQMMGCGLTWEYPEVDYELSQTELEILCYLGRDVNNRVALFKTSEGYHSSFMGKGAQESKNPQDLLPALRKLEEVRALLVNDTTTGSAFYELSGAGYRMFEKVDENL